MRSAPPAPRQEMHMRTDLRLKALSVFKKLTRQEASKVLRTKWTKIPKKPLKRMTKAKELLLGRVGGAAQRSRPAQQSRGGARAARRALSPKVRAAEAVPGEARPRRAPPTGPAPRVLPALLGRQDQRQTAVTRLMKRLLGKQRRLLPARPPAGLWGVGTSCQRVSLTSEGESAEAKEDKQDPSTNDLVIKQSQGP